MLCCQKHLQLHLFVLKYHQFQLEQLLLPFKEKLNTFENEVRAQKEHGIAQFSSMESLVKALSEQHQQMNHSAQNLADALKGDQKTQGNWGELALERILEISGLQEGVEYEKQHTLKDENDKVLFNFFMLSHLKYDVKVGKRNNKFILLVPFENEVYKKAGCD